MRFVALALFLFSVKAFAQQPKLMLPIAHTSPVMEIQFSPDDKRIATASGSDQTVKIWDVQTGALLADLKGHTASINQISFSPDGQKIVSGSDDNTARIWDAVNGSLLLILNKHTEEIKSAQFSPTGKIIATGSQDSTVKLWDANTGKLIFNLQGHQSPVLAVGFSRNGKKIISGAADGITKVWDTETGKLLFTLKGHHAEIQTAIFSGDDTRIVTASFDSTAEIWDANTGKLLFNLKGHRSIVNSARFSPDNKKIITSSWDSTAGIWNAANGKYLSTLYITDACENAFYADDTTVITCTWNETNVWDIKNDLMVTCSNVTTYAACTSANGKLLAVPVNGGATLFHTGSKKLISKMQGHTSNVSSASFTPDGKKLVTSSDDNIIRIWDAFNGNFLFDIPSSINNMKNAAFSSDSRQMLVITEENSVGLWDLPSGKNVGNVISDTHRIKSAIFSPDRQKILTISSEDYSKIWDAATGKLFNIITSPGNAFYTGAFSPDGKMIATTHFDSIIRIWNVETGKLVKDIIMTGNTIIRSAEFSSDGENLLVACNYWQADSRRYEVTLIKLSDGSTISEFNNHSSLVEQAVFSPDGKKIISSSLDNSAKVWDVSSGKVIADLKGHDYWVNTAQFSPDGKKAITASGDNTIKLWDVEKGNELYTFFVVDSSDYLVVDKDNHYDGTDGARKLLYFTCGTEVISLQQVKDKLWIPGLAERILKNEKINTEKLSDLNICGLTPIIKQIPNKTGYQYKINPQRGGLGQTILYVNGIETKKYEPSQLKKTADGYELLVPKTTLKAYLTPGKENKITLKSFTSGNDIASRGADVTEEDEVLERTPPNLYAVVIGVSDYKGDVLDLKYAAKDASDISAAISSSASKLLGREHVFTYDLNTGVKRDNMPEKKSIRDVFTEIGKKASANDILFVFFAGHGVVQGIKKKFYFLTSDASDASISEAGIKDAGISTEELMDWMKPATIKAQKRILILDACNSGSAINQIVNIGKDQGYIAARNEDKAEEIRQIDKLNEKAGLYVLAASASNQSAYELGRYSQGLLTYSLLKVMKEHPEILEEGKFLNVSGWFNAAVKVVTDIVHESNLRQEPQLITTSNFNIGIVDEEVLAKIILPNEKPLFGASSFQNMEDYDELDIGKAVNKKLVEVSSRGTDGGIAFMITTESPDAYILSGRYEVKQDEIILRANVRQNKEKVPKYRFEIKGKKDDIKSFAQMIVDQTILLTTNRN